MNLRDLFLYSSLALASCASSRSISALTPATRDSENTGELVSRAARYRCGPKYGKCPNDRCCSVAGKLSMYRILRERSSEADRIR